MQSFHRMHTETLLNPFYSADYATQDDGQDHQVFTQLQEEIPYDDRA